jgi:hypothetical protein
VEPAETVLSWQDLATASRHQAVRSRVWLLLVPLCALLVGLAVTAPVPAISVMAVVLVVFVATIPLWGPTAATWMQARHRAWPSTPTRWRVAGEGLAIESQGKQSTLPWASLSRCDPWRRGVSLRCGRASVFIPDRAFRGPEHRQDFVGQVQTSLEAGSVGRNPAPGVN